ncbi:hypothetical protein HNR26_002322 [Rhizobium rosettiformans]|uniref:Uncharacterized protein n=2 Tax=Rhizobium rosettiformans TaxID=1368430 RepID=A0A4S8Q2Z8_9HYPH|nr:hypothetical protein [Rhizobium rosettiformans]MBB5276270.1 hypothetical protein [Rhizobium rosettiformans]THV36902.1 hypothetical protein FAA86_10430 [Rhizobium rosettiformans W3]
MEQKVYPILTRLVGVETRESDDRKEIIIRLEFEVDNPDDLYQVEVRFDPVLITNPEQLRPLFDKHRIAISPKCIDVWDEAVATLFAQQ